MMDGEVANLLGLLADDLAGVVQVVVDELLVGDVGERGEVDDGGEEEGQAPGWGDLDEEVGQEGGGEGLEVCVSWVRLVDTCLPDLRQQ